MSSNPGRISEISGSLFHGVHASRPVESIVRISEIESAKSTAELKTSKSITGADLQSHFKVLDSKIASGQEIHQRDLKKEGSSRRSCTKKGNVFSQANGSHG